MPQIKWSEISLGNILSIVSTIAMIFLFSITTTSAVESIRKELEKKDLEHDLKIRALEVKVDDQARDHDRIVSMESDIKFIRQTLEAKR